MEGFRIVNLSVQSVYLIAHLYFLFRMGKMRQPSPVWDWFMALGAAIWLWVLGRFMESVVYLFLPGHNAAYQFAANFQYIGNSAAAAIFLIWNLYLTGRGRLADRIAFKTAVFLLPVTICVLVFTNPAHHLFYTKLDMGERVAHGMLFLPSMLSVYLMLLTGLMINVVHTIRYESDKLRRILIFSMVPVLPAVATLIRSLSGVDRFDYTPLIMTVSLYFLYLTVFKFSYITMIPQSIESALSQTDHPIVIVDPKDRTVVYRNQQASDLYRALIDAYLSDTAGENLQADGARLFSYQGRQVKAEQKVLEESGQILLTMTDLTDLRERQTLLDHQIDEQHALIRELSEQRRNMDAYLEAMVDADLVKAKYDALNDAREKTATAFERMEANLEKAGQGPAGAEETLRENLSIAEETIALIRLAVATLKEELP